jgi:hypothetical protein
MALENQWGILRTQRLCEEKEKCQDPSTQLTHCGKIVGGHDGLLGCSVGLVGWVYPPGWKLVSSHLFFVPTLLRVEYEPGRKYLFMKKDETKPKLILLRCFLQALSALVERDYVIWVVFSAIGEFGYIQVRFSSGKGLVC